mmetsp:Transcript_8739/g.13040  ORF Transcript_8739/g.13040 Transcript_8739/m.13040 type:complete len:262 (+) Transcript_8739:300-1085(+)
MRQPKRSQRKVEVIKTSDIDSLTTNQKINDNPVDCDDNASTEPILSDNEPDAINIPPKLMMDNNNLQVNMFPVAVYEAVWLQSVEAVIVHMTLIEQIFGKSKKAYWLRVGVVLPHHDEESSAKLEEDEGRSEEFHVLAVLSNDAGRLIMDRPADWVDLPAIDAAEYFMVAYRPCLPSPLTVAGSRRLGTCRGCCCRWRAESAGLRGSAREQTSISGTRCRCGKKGGLCRSWMRKRPGRPWSPCRSWSCPSREVSALSEPSQ